MEWIVLADQKPRNKQLVMTRLNDHNTQPLYRVEGLWFTASGHMQYYRPSHWRSLTNLEKKQMVIEKDFEHHLQMDVLRRLLE